MDNKDQLGRCQIQFHGNNYKHFSLQTSKVIDVKLYKLSDTSPTHQQTLLVRSRRPWKVLLPTVLLDSGSLDCWDHRLPSQAQFRGLCWNQPQWIFVLQSSQLISESVWGTWPTAIFTWPACQLSYSSGGRPLQNLTRRWSSLARCLQNRCCVWFKTGDVFLSQALDLHGSAAEFF